MVDRISNARKKELEQPDPFLDKLQTWANITTKFRKQIILIIGAVLVVVLIFAGMIYSNNSSEEKASDFLAQVLAKYSDADPVKGYETVKDDITEFIASYPNTTASSQARVMFAEIAFKASKFEEAHKRYLNALDDFKKDPLITNLLLASLGRTCLAMNQKEEAETYFRKISDGKSPLLKGEALFNLGVLLADKGDKAASQKMFQDVVAFHGESLYKPMAEALIIKD